MLFHHVFDLDAVQLAEFQGGFQSAVGIVGVDVRLHKVEVAYDEHAVAYGHQVVAIFIDVRFRHRARKVGDEKLGTILESDVFVVVVEGDELLLVGGRDLGGSSLCRVEDGDLAACQRGVHPLHYRDQPATARVHNARLREHGEHLGSPLQYGFARLYHLGEELFKSRPALFCEGGRRLSHDSDDGEDGAFLGLCDSAVGYLGAALQGCGKVLLVHGDLSVHRDGEAFQYLRKYDAAVAARALQRALGECDRDRAHVVGRRRSRLPHGGGHSEGHIGARITVRHGENIELVYDGTVEFESFHPSREHYFISISV